MKYNEKIMITLPDGRKIQRVLHTLNEGIPLIWVKVKNIDFYVDYYDLNDTTKGYRLSHCFKDDFLKAGYPRIMFTDKEKASGCNILAVKGSCFDNEYYDVIGKTWFTNVR